MDRKQSPVAVLVSMFFRKETRLTCFRSSLGMYPISLSYTSLHIGGLSLAKAPPPTNAAVHTRSESKPLQNYPAARFANAFTDRTADFGIARSLRSRARKTSAGSSNRALNRLSCSRVSLRCPARNIETALY